jgi:uncharacterized repeat protein (TIGR04138 family)
MRREQTDAAEQLRLMETDPSEQIEQAIRKDGRYPPEAYDLLHRGLKYAARMVYGDEPGKRPQHVSGQELCEALRRLALERWGPLVREVLAHWNIHRTRDFGDMVYLLIGLGVMGKQDSDRLEDFDDVYDFDQAFGSYQITLDDPSE